jgi:hypothetical protein
VAGQDELPGGNLDALGAGELARACERSDATVSDADLTVLDVAARRREAASHDEVQHR